MESRDDDMRGSSSKLHLFLMAAFFELLICRTESNLMYFRTKNFRKPNFPQKLALKDAFLEVHLYSQLSNTITSDFSTKYY